MYAIFICIYSGWCLSINVYVYIFVCIYIYMLANNNNKLLVIQNTYIYIFANLNILSNFIATLWKKYNKKNGRSYYLERFCLYNVYVLLHTVIDQVLIRFLNCISQSITLRMHEHEQHCGFNTVHVGVDHWVFGYDPNNKNIVFLLILLFF